MCIETGNGVQDAGESGIANVAVQLRNGATVVASTTTNATCVLCRANEDRTDRVAHRSGYYAFDSLQPGNALPQLTSGFVVSVNQSQVRRRRCALVLALIGDAERVGVVRHRAEQGGGGDGDEQQRRRARRDAAPRDGGADDARVRRRRSANRLWLCRHRARQSCLARQVRRFVGVVLLNSPARSTHSNANGVQDVGENGIAGVVVELLDATTNATIATKTTDASGL